MSIKVVKECPTYEVSIYLSEPVEFAEQAIRGYTLDHGTCVTVEPTKFIYVGGEELGYVVSLRNYPRFPKTEDEIWEQAKELAVVLLDAGFQHSVMVVGPKTTLWMSKREQNA